jgi:hypothetical protein
MIQKFEAARSGRLFFFRKQVGAIAKSFFEGHAVAPLSDFGVVAADEDLGDFPAAIVGGAGVVGKIEQGAAVGERFVESGGLRFFGAFEQAERFILRRGFVAESAGEQAGDGVDDESGGEFAAGENEIADGDFFGGEMFSDAFVDAFVAPAKKKDAVQLRVAAGGFLGEALAGGGEQDDGGVRMERWPGGGVAYGMAEERFDCFEEWFGLKNHTFAAAEGAIVDGAMAVFGEFAQILDVDVDDGGFAGATDDAVLERAGEEFGEDGNQVEAHRLEVYQAEREKQIPRSARNDNS